VTGSDATVVMIVVGMIASAMIGAGIGSAKGNRATGFVLGALLGPLGIIVAAVMQPSKEFTSAAASVERSIYRQCPHCKENMRRDAGTCPHCRLQSEAWRLHEGYWWANGYWLRESDLTWQAPAKTG